MTRPHSQNIWHWTLRLLKMHILHIYPTLGRNICEKILVNSLDLSRNSPSYMEPQLSIPCSQDPAIISLFCSLSYDAFSVTRLYSVDEEVTSSITRIINWTMYLFLIWWPKTKTTIFFYFSNCDTWNDIPIMLKKCSYLNINQRNKEDEFNKIFTNFF
jgi:hypothetical protein